MTGGGGGAEWSVLVVCTANVTRSPAAAALLRAHVRTTGLPLAVTSAGVLADIGAPASPVMRREGGPALAELVTHRARQLTADDLAAADLVLVMERRHLLDVAALDPTAIPRAFTVRELHRAGHTTPPTGQGIDAWLATVHERRTLRDLLCPDAADDVADPSGRSARTHRRVLAELDRLTAGIVDHLRRADAAVDTGADPGGRHRRRAPGVSPV